MKTPRMVLPHLICALVLVAGLVPIPTAAGASPMPQPPELWIMNADGSEPRAPLQPSEPYDYSMSYDKPSWSPSGTEIAVGGRTLRVVPAAGGEPRTVANMQATSPQWSPDGTWIAFSGWASDGDSATPDDRGLFLVRPDGTELHHLGPNHQALAPQWAPDASKVAFVSAISPHEPFLITLVDLQGTATTLGSDWGHGSITWGPDSQRLAYTDRDSILTIVTIGGTTEKVTAAGEAFAARWSRDGTRFALTTQGALVVVNSDGSGRTVIDEDGFTPDWHPASTALAFAGMSDILSAAPDGSGLTNLTMTPDRYDSTPAWSPDGTQIAYISAAKPYIPPDETKARAVTLWARGTVLKGRVISDYSYCSASTETHVQIQRRGPDGWVVIATVNPVYPDGRFKSDVGRRHGRFRAFVAAHQAPSVAGNRITCAEATSPVVRIVR
ncbi:MAG TPA: hypothetical protein VNC78_05700 [Actinomycetota bacterium]|nr:hypothetical protein [Actinomycetota bacterium]